MQWVLKNQISQAYLTTIRKGSSNAKGAQCRATVEIEIGDSQETNCQQKDYASYDDLE